MATIRTFIAVNVSAKIQSNASKLIERLSNQGTDYKWVQRGNMHVTLNFLGDVDEREIPEVCKRVKNAVTGQRSFELMVHGLGCFPKPDKPKVVWLGSSEGSESLTQLNHVIGQEMLEMRFPLDRNDYHPHLTLGRLRRGGRWNQSFTDSLEQYSDFEAGSCHISDVIVYSTYLDKVGPTYTALSTISLD